MSVEAGPAWKSPPYPFLYEINTWPWLHQVARAEGRAVDLANVPGRYWDAIAAAGFDAVWLMGVWRRSPAGIAIALANPDLVAEFQRTLPGYTSADVVGSPYCVRDYVVDDHLGGPDGLAAARAALAKRGLGLVLDFVPNHVAPDHPWAAEHPDRFVLGTDDDLDRDPASFVRVGDHVLANGRDPYFPAWPDVVQLDAFSPGLRSAVVETLRSIADQCDGVRCDMAMLLLNDVFRRTWGTRAGAPPADDYWTTVIPGVRQTHPDFKFLAEAYWDLEFTLQEQGFDWCYDKRLYDRLLHESPESVRLHLCADEAYQSRLVRFLENHDEPRAASLVDPRREKALAVATLTQSGARLFHDGQAEGRKVHLPVFLGRFPDEPFDSDLAAFHRSLLHLLSDPTFRHGRWRLCERSGWDPRFANLVSWCWQGETRWLVVVNLSEWTSAGMVTTHWEDLRGRRCRLVDDTASVTYERDGSALCDGLYVQLEPWKWHLFRVDVLEE
ncbi:MAG TPA: alpha-amylase family glycosyl hydrolase [Acidimicrobiales bacterium]|nr:alpha-amylase family glycosyl hydrolase [Acidimicrobiales bacterium]